MTAATFFAYCTLLGHIVLALSVVLFFVNKSLREKITALVRTFGYTFAFLLSLVAMVGSLYFEFVVGWEPCVLCWYQRIAIYPLVAVFAIGILNEDDKASVYAWPLVIIGIGIAMYQYYLQIASLFFPADSFFCTTFGSVDCADIYLREFGYITFPMFAITALVFIALTLLVKRNKI
tara:strand:+ start:246 stop:776 length:531 start_codon:yes stop_codon:yes gene_type:complete